MRIIVLLISCSLLSASVHADYLSGGSQPFPPDVQEIFDEHAEMLSLGINSDWMAESLIQSEPFAQAVDTVAKAVRDERIPGAVIYVGRTFDVTKMMPTAIGNKIVHPEKRKLEYSTEYSLDDMKGPLITVPMTFSAIDDGRFTLETKVHEVLPELSEAPVGDVTIEQLLRHASGLERAGSLFEAESHEEILTELKTLELASSPGTNTGVHSANFLLLGLMLDADEKSFPEQTYDQLLEPLNLPPDVIDPRSDRRQTVAPGHYDEQLGRMIWMEAPDPAGRALGPAAGHSNLNLSADAVAGLAVILNFLEASNTDAGTSALTPLGEAFIPDSSIKGGASMGAGYQLGRFGARSFGWDSPNGSSFWVLPEAQAIIVYLSNPTHPSGLPEDFQDPRETVLPLLHSALSPLPEPTEESPEEP